MDLDVPETPDEIQEHIAEVRRRLGREIQEIGDTARTRVVETTIRVHRVLDWRRPVRAHPLAALAAGLALGYLAGR